MNKTTKDMYQHADELLLALLTKIYGLRPYVSPSGSVTINYSEGRNIIAAYLLDRWNEGYDASIIANAPKNRGRL